MPGDKEPYPESFEDRDVSLLVVNLDGGVRWVVSRPPVIDT